MIENDVQIKLSDLNYSTMQNSADLIRDFHTALYGLKILFDEQPAYLPKIFAVYNKREATPVTYEAQKVLFHKAFRASFTLVAARYIAAGDPERGGHLPLGQGDGTAQPIAQADDLRFPGGKALRHQPVQLPGAVPVVKIVQHGVVHAHHVQ